MTAAALALAACRATGPAARSTDAPAPVADATAAASDTVPVAGAPSDTTAARAAADSLAAHARTATDPATAVRFEILAVEDSTFTFLAARAPWLQTGQGGIVVDPRRRDLLVARFTVLALRGDSARGLVTGQTMPLALDHVALVNRPPEPPVVLARAERRISRRGFGWGAALGTAVGLLAGLLIR